MNTAVSKNAPAWLCIESPDYSTLDPTCSTGRTERITTPSERKLGRPQAVGPEGTISIPLAVDRFGCPYSTIYNAARFGKVRSVTEKGCLFVFEEDVDAFVRFAWRGRKSA